MTIEEHVDRIRALIEEHWPSVPDDDPGPKLRLDIEAGPARGPTTAGTIHVSFHSTYEYREEAWRAFEEAVEVLAAAGYERVDSGRGALTRGSGFFCPIAAPDG